MFALSFTRIVMVQFIFRNSQPKFYSKKTETVTIIDETLISKEAS